MVANRRVSILAGATIAVVLLFVLIFAGGPDAIFPPSPPEAESVSETKIVEPAALPAGTAPESAAEVSTVVKEKPPVRAAKTMPLTVRVIDGETGITLDGARPTLVLADKRKLLLTARGDRFLLEDAPLERGGRFTLNFEVEVPFDYSLQRNDRGFAVGGTISRFAESAHVTIPAWPHAIVRVQVVDHEGRPVEGAAVGGVECVGYRSTKAAPTDSAGWTTVKGVPAIRGESIQVSGQAMSRSAIGYGRVQDSLTPVRITVRLPEEEGGMIGIGGGAGGAFRGRGDRRWLRRTGTGVLTVTVKRRDGRPAAHTAVIAGGKTWSGYGRTDPHGRITIKGFHAEEIAVRVREPGFLMGDAVTVRIVEGEPAAVSVHEAQPKWAAALVLDEQGHSLPAATVSVTTSDRQTWICLDRGVQHLNLLSGPDGRVVIPNVPPSGVKILATFVRRNAKAKIRSDGFTELKLGRTQ
jgi:hypothetical protein